MAPKSQRNPLATNAAYEQHVRERAYHLWESEGKPFGHDIEYWERARELIGIEESAGSGLLPNPVTAPASRQEIGIEEADVQQNMGEFPGQLTDQGDAQPTPVPRKRSRTRTKKT